MSFNKGNNVVITESYQKILGNVGDLSDICVEMCGSVPNRTYVVNGEEMKETKWFPDSTSLSSTSGKIATYVRVYVRTLYSS